MSLDPAKQAEMEMQQLLESIPRSKYFPMPRNEVLDNAISSLESTINRLKAFVRFLSMLNPMQYLKWMADAYMRYVPGKTTNNHRDNIEESLSLSATQISPRKRSFKASLQKTTKKSKQRRNVPPI